MKRLFPVLCLSWLVAAHSFAGSATWNLNPTSGDWNTATNWTPNTVPNGHDDVATFGVSNQATVAPSAKVALNNLVFDAGASSYSIMVEPQSGISIGGAGIVNNSGIDQSFFAVVDGKGRQGKISFYREASAGFGTIFHAAASTLDDASATGAVVAFNNYASGGTADYEVDGGILKSGFGGTVNFYQHASADSGYYQIGGGTVKHSIGGSVVFFDASEAGNATIRLQGATAPEAGGGRCIFDSNSSAANATLIALPSSHNGDGGQIYFNDESDGGSARVQLFGNALMALLNHPLPISVGSIEGDGMLDLSFTPLSVGNNNLSTTFSGLIEGQIYGTFEKTGNGILILSGANTYLGSTTVSGGALMVANKTGSATGNGSVFVSLGNLGGGGTIYGSVTIGTGVGAGAALAPSFDANRPTTTTIQSMLTFKSDGTYTYKLNTNKAEGDHVIANGTTIESRAQFSFNPVANQKLTIGTVFTAISNTAATPISGTFANLADGSTVTVGSNTFQFNYEGGDGNDLTLTVVP